MSMIINVVLFIIFLIFMSALFSIFEIVGSLEDGVNPSNIWNIFFIIALIITIVYLDRNDPECGNKLIYLYITFIFFVLLVSLIFWILNMGTLEGSTKGVKMIEHGLRGNFWSLL